MKAQDQVRTKEKRLGVARRAITWLAIAGIAVGVFFGRFYFVRGFVLFLIGATFLAFLAGHLVVLGFLCRATGQGILRSVREAKPGVAEQGDDSSERQTGPVVGSRTVRPAAGFDSP